MERKNHVDLKIYGQGSSAGGKFNDVIIKGTGKIGGDVDCINFKIYGDGEVDGNLKADNVKIKGHAGIKGNLETEKFKIQGDVQIYGNLQTEEAVIAGNIQTNGNFNAEIFSLEGGFTIDGLLNADELKITLYLPCKVHEIGGAKITVKKETKLSLIGLKNMIMPNESHKKLTAEVIEGDDIYLEHTRAKVVRGNNIELGPECEIELVEYKNNFKQDERSEVSTHKKI
jgi:cytoskeletal protein CcmA (bactofilin family)